MRGLLADVNVQGHLLYLCQRLEALDEWDVVAALGLDFKTFSEIGLDESLDDRTLWNYCQIGGWVLFTENRNADDADSLQVTLADSWRIGCLPVVTLGNKGKFQRNREYADRVASDVAELLFGIVHAEYCDQPRIFVPRTAI